MTCNYSLCWNEGLCTGTKTEQNENGSKRKTYTKKQKNYMVINLKRRKMNMFSLWMST